MDKTPHIQYQTQITYVSRENYANFNVCSQEIEFTGAQENFSCSRFNTSRVIRFHALYKLIYIIIQLNFNLYFLFYSHFFI